MFLFLIKIIIGVDICCKLVGLIFKFFNISEIIWVFCFIYGKSFFK